MGNNIAVLNTDSIYSNDLSDYIDANKINIDCLWTDPPYFLSNGGTTCKGGERVSVNKGTWDTGEMDQFNNDWVTAMRCVTRMDSSWWVSCTMHNIASICTALKNHGLKVLNIVTWEKPNPPPNLGCRCFTHSTEFLVLATHPDARGRCYHHFDYSWLKEENGGKQMKDVWRFTAPSAKEKTYGAHPTQKPVALVERCIRASCPEGGWVLDPFCGSGTTGVAALQSGRRALLAEKDPTFAVIAHKRCDGYEL